MIKIVTIYFAISMSFSSCSDYKKEEVGTSTITNLNKQILDGSKSGNDWSLTPESIARYLFPPVSHDGPPKIYQVKKEKISNEKYVITVLEEGAIDDEVLGEKHTIYFELDKGRWKISQLDYALKRRD
jgi:hypothetical protein